MKNINAIIEHVEQGCKANGKQLTAKRELVLRALVHSNRALSAYELVDYCKEQFNQIIPAMSVYRILEFLEGEHLAHKIQVSNKYVACSHILRDCEHGVSQFFICSKCEKITERTIDPKVIVGLQSTARKEGFTVVSPQLEICCVCDECAKQS